MGPRALVMLVLACSLALTAGCVGALEDRIQEVDPRQAPDGTDPNRTEEAPEPTEADGSNGSAGDEEQQEPDGNASSEPSGAQDADDSEEADGSNETGRWAGDPRVTGLQPIGIGPSPATTTLEVLLVPPTHGDLGEPTNESRRALDYLNATIDGIHDWERAIDWFVTRYPTYSYMDRIEVQIHVLDQETPAAVGWDVIVAYVETAGPVFRGAATTGTPVVQPLLNDAGVGDQVHVGERVILLSLFSSSPRANQTVPDYPETREVHDVTMHEFGHTFGLGHSTTWTARWGPDLMNSPYPFVYGDGDPLGDGGERSPTECISTLDLYGLSQAYAWLEGDGYEAADGNVTLPASIGYEEVCFPGTQGIEQPSGPGMGRPAGAAAHPSRG